MKDYGKELILDLRECDSKRFNRRSIRRYFKHVCALIDMERAKVHWWDDLYTPEAKKETEPHLVGTSAIQFIKTSNITIHTLDKLEAVFLNVFSCKDFDADKATSFTASWFAGKVTGSTVIRRRLI